jgi:propanol-preferring alcohol dehydrogenase
VANLTRRDAVEFLALAAEHRIRATANVYPLEDAGDALLAIAEDAVRGAAVLDVAGSR